VALCARLPAGAALHSGSGRRHFDLSGHVNEAEHREADVLSVAAILAESALRRPGHPAVVFGEEEVTYRDLWEQALQYAAVLAEHGVGPGDSVALLLMNTPEFPRAYFGVLALGAVSVPVNGLLKAEEIEYVLRDSGAKALICAGPLLAEGGKAASAAGVALFTVEREHDGEAPRLDVLAERAAPIHHYMPRLPDDIAVVLYTSGTTGKPKGAMLTHLNVVMNVATTMLAPFAFQERDVLLGCLPLSHTFGQICGMNTCFRAGATMVLMPRFSGPQALETMVKRRCTVFMGVPTMYLALLDTTLEDRRRPPLERAFCGGSPLPVPVLNAFQQTFGCVVNEGYGLTEASPVVAYHQPPWPAVPGTVGRPIWGVEVEIARPDVEGRIDILAAGEVGEVVVRGHNVMAGYLNRPEATAEVIVDGWLRSGDLGVKDADGNLTIVDRKKDIVLRGGFNVYPREVEEVLVCCPAIAQVAVIGVPHEVHGEEVCAVVVPRRGRQADSELGEEIIAWSRERLAAFKYPRLVEFVDALPLGPSGKVLKRELAARYGR
jgi:long-chain acyl-CoA synthetase